MRHAETDVARALALLREAEGAAACHARRAEGLALDLLLAPARPASPSLLGRAARELAVVHAIEQSRLMAEAAERCIEAHLDAAPLLPPARLPRGGIPWSVRLANELRLARADGSAVPAAVLACAFGAPGDWPLSSARRLAEEALRVHPTLAARDAWARARLAEGDVHEALAVLDEAPPLPSAHRGHALRERERELWLACAHEARCELPAALERFFAAAGAGSAWAAGVAAGLASALGGGARARRARDLARRVAAGPGAREELARAARDVARRAAAWRAG